VKKSTWLWIAAGAAAIYLYRKSKKGTLKGLGDDLCTAYPYPNNPYRKHSQEWNDYERRCSSAYGITQITGGGGSGDVSGGGSGYIFNPDIPVNCDDPRTWADPRNADTAKRGCALYKPYVKRLRAVNVQIAKQSRQAHIPKAQWPLHKFGECISGIGVCP
jgi:hypothetical protein